MIKNGRPLNVNHLFFRSDVSTLLLTWLAIFDTIYLFSFMLSISITELLHFYTSSASLYGAIMWAYGIPVTSIIASMTSGMNVLLIIHRFVCICFPIRSLTSYTVRFTCVQIFVTFTVCAVFEIPRFMEYRIQTSNDTNHKIIYATRIWDIECYTFWYKFILVLVFKRLCPIVIMIVLTYKIVAALNQSQQQSLRDGQHIYINKPRDRVTRVIIVVSLFFIASQIPSAIYPIMREFVDKYSLLCKFFLQFQNTADFFFLFNSAINFWLYFTVSREFRAKLYKVLGFKN